MGEATEHDSKWEEDIYWNHFRYTCFFEKLPSYRGRLGIPKKFADKLGKKLPASVILRAPNGATHNIGIKAQDGALYFKQGWQEFASDYSLQDNDLLVFKYNGEAQFDVLLFDIQTKCEREASYFFRASGSETTEETTKQSTKWQEDAYWTHFRSIHFMQFIPTNFQRQVGLPRKFCEKLRKELPENVVLKGPSGAKWNVGLTMSGDILVFSDGWQEFVRDLSLKERDLLIFRYNGESQFEVFVFDLRSKCEIEALYFTKRNTIAEEASGNHRKRKNISGSYIEEIDNFSDTEMKRSSSENISDNSLEGSRIPRIKQVVQNIADKKIQPCGATSSSKRRGIFTPGGRFKARTDKRKYIRGGERSKKYTSTSKKYTSTRRPATISEEMRVQQSAIEAAPKGSFLVTMRSTYVYTPQLVLPANLVWEHLSAEITEMILRIKEKTWNTKIFCRSPGRALLTRGWRDFVRDNTLEESDVCVFTPTNCGRDSGAVIFDISIFRAVQEVTSLT